MFRRSAPLRVLQALVCAAMACALVSAAPASALAGENPAGRTVLVTARYTF